MKFRIRNKVYRLLKEVTVSYKDRDFIKERYIVVDSKKEEYTLIRCLSGYSLYDSNENYLFTTLSIQRI